MDWTRAKCASLEDPDLMYPEAGRAHKKQRMAAKAVCRGQDGRGVCPIREMCRDAAIAAEDFTGGIWGGLSDRERRAYVRTGYEPFVAEEGRQRRDVHEDARLHGRSEERKPAARRHRKDAAGGGRGQRAAQGRTARQRTSEVVVLPTSGLPSDFRCRTARGLGEDALTSDLRGGSRRPREVAALGAATRSSVRGVVVRRLRVVVDGDLP